MAWFPPKTFADLEAMTDAQLREAYDDVLRTASIQVGINFILEELSRRREARLVFLTWVIATLTAIVAILTLVITVVTLTD